MEGILSAASGGGNGKKSGDVNMYDPAGGSARPGQGRGGGGEALGGASEFQQRGEGREDGGAADAADAGGGGGQVEQGGQGRGVAAAAARADRPPVGRLDQSHPPGRRGRAVAQAATGGVGVGGLQEQ